MLALLGDNAVQRAIELVLTQWLPHELSTGFGATRDVTTMQRTTVIAHHLTRIGDLICLGWWRWLNGRFGSLRRGTWGRRRRWGDARRDVWLRFAT